MEGHENLIHDLILIGALGIGAQWLAWALRVPAIVLLTLAGLAAGPLLGWIEPEEDFGPLLRPFIAIAVALILFEGGLSLRFHEFREAGSGVRRLVSLGAALSWLFGAAAAHFIAGLSWPVALLLGAILVVTGPTVILPLLRQARLARRPGSYLKWEGTLNDPIGALLAVLLFEFFAQTRLGAKPLAAGGAAEAEEARALVEVLLSLGLAALAAAALGIGGGLLLRGAFRRGWVPGFLKAPLVFGAALVAFGLNNLVLAESGLVAATILGIVLGNTRNVGGIREVRRFKEYLTLILVSGVFVVLTANLDPEVLTRIGWREAAFLAAMLLLVRPAAVVLATLGDEMSWRERALVGWIAPRGVVAASVAGFFGPEMAARGYPDAEMLVPLVFAMIFLTVVLHGFSLPWFARRLGLAAAGGEGVLIVGASPWSIDLAGALKRAGAPVLLTDIHEEPLRRARDEAGVPVYQGEILAGASEAELELHEIGYVFAATRNDPYNALVCADFAVEFGHERVFQLPLHETDAVEEGGPQAINPEMRGQIAIGDHAFFEDLAARHRRGWRFEATRVAAEGGHPDALLGRARGRPDDPKPVLLVRGNGALIFNTPRAPLDPAPGDTLVAFVPPAGEAGGAAA